MVGVDESHTFVSRGRILLHPHHPTTHNTYKSNMRTSIISSLLLIGRVSAFVSPLRSGLAGSSSLAASPADLEMTLPAFDSASLTTALDAKEGLKAYADFWVPMFTKAREMGAPDLLLHWGHGAAMATVLLTMGLAGAYTGWQIRLGNGGDTSNALTLGESMREAHPKLMGAAFFFFFLGGQGGLVLLDTQTGSVLESPHARTAALSFGLLTVQALLPKLFPSEQGGETARTAHAYLGSATMVVLFGHLVTGLNLGFSF